MEQNSTQRKSNCQLEWNYLKIYFFFSPNKYYAINLSYFNRKENVLIRLNSSDYFRINMYVRGQSRLKKKRFIKLNECVICTCK